MKPTVAHYNDVFYYKSETFIYQKIQNLKNFIPVYLARQYENLNLFEIPDKDRYTIPYESFRKYTFSWLYYGILKKIFKIIITPEEVLLSTRKVKIIHAHFGPQGFFAINLRGNSRIPIVTNFYGYDVSELIRDQMWIDRYKELFHVGDLFLVEGPFMRSRLIKLGCPDEKIKIHRIGLNLDDITFRARHPKKECEKVILCFTGRFYEKKGLIYALQALALVRTKYENFEFRIIGDGPLMTQIKEIIQQNQLANHVTLLGFLNYTEYLNELSMADIFIHPSVTAENGDSEGGAPTVILEAQAMGIPIISTFHDDIPNIVVPDKSALLSEEKDVDSLAANILQLLRNQDQWEQMGQCGRKFVEENHNIKTEINKLEEMYANLL